MIQLSLTQGDNRYCVVGHRGGDQADPEIVGWTSDPEMAWRIAGSAAGWRKFGSAHIMDFYENKLVGRRSRSDEKSSQDGRGATHSA